jgi:tetratricopeptide (TPR) repeat protein
LSKLGTLAREQSDLATAEACYQESLALAREIAHRSGAAMALHNLGWVALDRMDYDQAESFFTQSLALWRETGEQTRAASSLFNLGRVAQAQGQLARAQVCYRESLAMRAKTGNKPEIAACLKALAHIAANQGDSARARRLLGAATALADGSAASETLDASLGLTTTVDSALDRSTAEAAWREGQSLTWEQVVACALGNRHHEEGTVPASSPASSR